MHPNMQVHDFTSFCMRLLTLGVREEANLVWAVTPRGYSEVRSHQVHLVLRRRRYKVHLSMERSES